MIVQCYLDGVQLGLKDPSFNADACEQCRNTPCTKARHGSTLMEHSTSSKSTKLKGRPLVKGLARAGTDTRAGRTLSKTVNEKGKENNERKGCEREGGREGAKLVVSRPKLEGKFEQKGSLCQ